MGSSNLARSTFAASGALPVGDDLAMPEPACGNVTSGYYVCTCGVGMRGGNDYPTETADNPIPGDLWPGLSVAFNLSAVGATPSRATAIVSYDDLGLTTRFFGKVLPEYWLIQLSYLVHSCFLSFSLGFQPPSCGPLRLRAQI